MSEKYRIMIQLLLSCSCIVEEEIEAVIFSPSEGEKRVCKKHNREVVIQKVGTPFKLYEKDDD